MSLNEAQWRELGIWPRWGLRNAPSVMPEPVLVAEPDRVMPTPEFPQPESLPLPPAALEANSPLLLPDSWDALEAGIAACTRCGLHQGRHLTVPGTGDRHAPWFFVGEGPGAEEDQKGEPFVGQAGRLLDNMLNALELSRGQGVYIANVVKCRPPHNRNPEPDERQACLPWLHRQIEWVRPRVLVLLGKVAAESLLGSRDSISSLRAQVHEWQGIPVVVTWHPAYLLRSPLHKQEAWQDLCRARQMLQQKP